MKIAAFGEVMMRLSTPNYLMLSQTHQLDFRFCGTGVNFLSGLIQNGEEGYLLTCLPDHSVGKAAQSQIRSFGIHDEGILFSGNHMGVYFYEAGVYPRPSCVTYLDRNHSSFCQAQYKLDNFKSIVDQMDAIHFCGISLAMNTKVANFVLELASYAKSKGVKVIFDCNFRPSLWTEETLEQGKQLYQEMMKLSDIAFASSLDANNLGIVINQKEEKEILKEMFETFDLEVLFGTRRKLNQYQGYMVDCFGYIESEWYDLEIFDRIGAGDAFGAGAIHAYLHQKERQKTITYATMCGVLAHTTYGDVPVLSKEFVENVIENGYTEVKR